MADEITVRICARTVIKPCPECARSVRVLYGSDAVCARCSALRHGPDRYGLLTYYDDSQMAFVHEVLADGSIHQRRCDARRRMNKLLRQGVLS